MLPFAAAVVILAVTPPSAIRGGSPEQRAQVQAILDRLPECITAPGGRPVAVQIVSGSGPQATFVSADGTLRIDASLLDPSQFAASSEAFRQDMCATPGEIAWLAKDTRRVLVHELAHAYHHQGLTGRRLGRNEPETVEQRLDGFFNLRFDEEFEMWTNDPVRRETEEALAAALDEAQRYRKARKPVPREVLQEICDRHAELREMYEPTGLPARFRNDRHAVKEPEIDPQTGKPLRAGAEYFAIAVETLVGDHGIFCKRFTPEEQQWLATELGGCLGGLPGKSPCYPDSNNLRARPAAGAGTHRE